MLPDYYFELGIPFTADLAAIKKAYRAKAIAAHPDHGGSHEAMLRLNEAYEILANPDARRHYDAARANQFNESAQQQARADASKAEQRADQYPRAWTDFESWLAKDFTEAEYGQFGQYATAGNSISGALFVVIGMILGIACGFLMGLKGGMAPLCVAGGFMGRWVHQQLGESMKRPISHAPPGVDRNPELGPDGPKIIVNCPSCDRQLRLPPGARVRCPACLHEFSPSPTVSAQPQAEDSMAGKAAHDSGVGVAIIVGAGAFIILIFVCRFTVGDGLFSESHSEINWPGVWIGTGICSCIGYYLGRKL